VDLKIVAVSDFHKGSVYAPDGLNVSDLLKWDAEGKSLNEFGGGKYQYGYDAMETCTKVEADSLLEMTWTNLEDGMPAISHVEAALNNGMNVITTNKGPVVFGYDKLDAVARQQDRRFMIEGAIMSGTPIVSLMRNLPACDYTEISGILNGTCNYILSSMEYDGVDFDPALKEAQRLGYAEANPAFDIGGGDARAKAIILCRILKDQFPMDDIVLEGITGITKAMVDDAKANGKRYKLCAKLVFEDAKIKSISVKPELLCTKTDSLANVGGALNALNFKTDMLGGDLTMIGPGAGKVETGYSLFSDLMYLVNVGAKEC
jgi:homoserine dehydrogenase